MPPPGSSSSWRRPFSPSRRCEPPTRRCHRPSIPGTPTYVGLEDPVPDGPVAFDPTRNMLQAFFDADQAAGGGSYWIDRVLERPGEGAGGAGERALYTKGSALFMYTHNANMLGFAGPGHRRQPGRRRLRLSRADRRRRHEPLHRRRSPAARSRSRPPSDASTRATGRASTRAPACASTSASSSPRTTSRSRSSTLTNTGSEADHPHDHRRARRTRSPSRRRRQRADRHLQHPLQPDHRLDPPQRRRLHAERRRPRPRGDARCRASP